MTSTPDHSQRDALPCASPPGFEGRLVRCDAPHAIPSAVAGIGRPTVSGSDGEALGTRAWVSPSETAHVSVPDSPTAGGHVPPAILGAWA